MKTAFITGATSGIGRAAALALCDAGYEVYALGRSQSALKELQAERSSIVPLAMNVTDRKALETVVADLTIDVLVNNAGVMPPLENFADMDIADIDAVLEINLNSAILLTRLVLPKMRERQSGHILFTGSTAGHGSYANIAVYSATKAAISGFVAGLKADTAPYGVRVTEIVCGRVETGLYKNILDEAARAAMYAGSVAVQPDDVARMIVAVLSLPPNADVTRFDIVPTRPVSPSGTK
ncbi:MAG: SDR family oxidoreductase [Rhizobiaceae bacterium]|nr:SDR family oxidoreductase [Rhizobiaceae bacterium]